MLKVVLLLTIPFWALLFVSSAVGAEKVVRMDLNGRDYSGQKLQEEDFTHADLIDSSFSGADLSGAILKNADLTKARFRNAMMIRANLTFANLTRADFSGADMTSAQLGGIFALKDAHHAIFKHTILRDATMTGINLFFSKYKSFFLQYDWC